jgi:hypothetical protein
MPDPISSVSHRDYSWPDLPTDRDDIRETLFRRVDERTYGVCGETTTVLGAALCGDKTAVSTACRRADPGTVDEWLCDDRNLEKIEKTCWDVAKKAAWKGNRTVNRTLPASNAAS